MPEDVIPAVISTIPVGVNRYPKKIWVNRLSLSWPPKKPGFISGHTLARQWWAMPV